MKTFYTIGIDEVGRGPIAGPVAVGAFIFLKPEAKKIFRGVKESKQLSENKREEWFSIIEDAKKSGLIDFYVAFQSEKIIDSKGISYALKKALSFSISKLVNRNRNRIKLDRLIVYLDGGLKAPEHFKNQKTIIRGDEKMTVIALASICAKVLRDRKMILIGKKYPKYGFEIHKGYGTRRHYDAIHKFGLIACHRRSFSKALARRGLAKAGSLTNIV